MAGTQGLWIICYHMWTTIIPTNVIKNVSGCGASLPARSFCGTGGIIDEKRHNVDFMTSPNGRITQITRTLEHHHAKCSREL